MFGVGRLYESYREEFLDVADEVLRSGRLLDGSNTKLFEDLIAHRCNRFGAVCVNSGTQAILFTLLYYTQIVKTKNILLPDISFVATANTSMLTGYNPIFADIDYHGMIDLAGLDLNSYSPEQVGIVMYVNLCGNMLDYQKLRLMTSFFDDNQPVIEDAAQSFGAILNGVPSGKCGDASIFSFDPTKNLPNFGSGGMVLSDDSGLLDFVCNLRDNGKSSKHHICGTNSKMSEVDCAQMLVKLKYFDQWQKRRSTIAEYYSYRLHDLVDVPRPMPGVTHAWSKYIIRTPDRDKIAEILTDAGIESKVNYSRPLHTLGIVRDAYTKNYKAGEYCTQGLALPIYPELTDSEVDLICDTICQFYT